MNSYSIIPVNELDVYGRLSRRARDEFGRLADSVLKVAGIAESGERGIGMAIQEHATKLHCSEGHLRRKVDEWRASGDWKCLVNKSLAGREWWSGGELECGDRNAFLEFWWSLAGKNQRGKCLTQYRALRRRLHAWRRGDETQKIPGYDAPPEDAEGCDHPAGWSYRTLMRSKPRGERIVQEALQHQGIAAAMNLLPGIPGTRVGARFLEWVTIDDVWQDRLCFYPGHGTPRVLQMGSMEYSSATYQTFGIQPALPGPDGKEERLKERCAKLVIAALLEKYGYPADYPMTIVCERGTATIRPADALALYQISNGHIRIAYTSMEGGLVFVWDEQKSGNPRGKGYHESWHNLFHNEMACLPGQVGKDPEHQPRHRLITRIQSDFPEAYVRCLVTSPRFKATCIEDLSEKQLTDLRNTLCARKPVEFERQRPAEAPSAVEEADNVPF
jgi:hypothetical protein